MSSSSMTVRGTVRESVTFQSKSYAQILTIDTSSPGGRLGTPEKRKHDPDSPPATPPSSKMLKLRHFPTQTKSQRQQHQSSELKRHKTVVKISVEDPSILSSSSTLSEVAKEVIEPTDMQEEKFMSSGEFLEQLEKEEKTNASGSHTIISTRASSHRPSLVVLQELASLEQPLRPSTRLHKPRRIVEERKYNPENRDDLPRRSLRILETPEKHLARQSLMKAEISTTSTISSKNTERQTRKVKEEKTEMAQEIKDDNIEPSLHNLRTRHSKTPERMVKASAKDIGVQSLRKDAVGEETKTKDQESKRDKKSQEVNIIAETPSSTDVLTSTNISEEKLEDTDAEPPVPNLRQTRRQSKTPERTRLNKNMSVSKEASEEKKIEENVLVSTRRTTRQSKTPERFLKTTESSSSEVDGVLDIIGQDLRRSSHRHSKTPERKNNVSSLTEKEEIEVEHKSKRQSKTPERFIKTTKSSGNEMEGVTDVAGHNLRLSHKQAKTPERKTIVGSSTKKEQKHKSKTPERKLKRAETPSSEMEEGIDVADHDLRSSRRQSKTPERKINVDSLNEKEEMKQRSKRQSKTPERLPKRAEKSSIEIEGMDVVEHNLRLTHRQSKTPERKTNVSSSKEEDLSVINEDSTAAMEEVSMNQRHFTRAPKTPERALKRKLQDDLADTEGILNATALKRTRGQSKTPERIIPPNITAATADPELEKEAEEDKSNLELRRSHRQSKTPERFVTNMVGAVRKSSRQHKSPEKLSTAEIESMPSASSPSSSRQKETSPSTPQKLTVPQLTDQVPTPIRKSSRQPKLTERLNTDEIEPVPISISPNR